MKLNKIYSFCLTAMCFLMVQSAFAQCETWNASPNKDALENEHIFYRDLVKAEKWAEAYPKWQKVYKAAPAANGQIATHYRDGRTIIGKLYAAETDASKQEEMKATFMKLYDQELECYPKDKKGNDKTAILAEDKAYNLYYVFNEQRDIIFDVLEASVPETGNNTGYGIIYPYADIAVTFFGDGKIDADKTLSIHKAINDICDHNIANNKKYSAYYQQQKDLANQRFDSVADALFGCAYHLPKIQAEYDADPNNPAVYKAVYDKLLEKGCGKEEALVKEVYAKVKRDADARNAELAEKRAADIASQKEEWAQNNPAIMAQRAYKSGDYQTAVAKYKEAINVETDASRKASYHYYLAVTYGRKLKQMSQAKTHIKSALGLDPSMGKAYNLWGDLIAGSARSCGSTPFKQRCVILAALSKWRKAKSVSSDPQVQSDAGGKISKYAGQVPDKEMIFLNGKKPGQSVSVGCWIGESVTLP